MIRYVVNEYGMKKLKEELKNLPLTPSALRDLEEPHVLFSWFIKCEDARDRGDNFFEVNKKYVYDGNPRCVWFDDKWFDERMILEDIYQ